MASFSKVGKKLSKGMHVFNRDSLGFRLISAFIAVIVIVVLSISALSITRWRSNALATLRSKGATMTRLLAAGARIGIFSENTNQLREAAESFTHVRDVLFVGIYNADKKPLYLSDPDFPGSGAISEGGLITGEEPAAQNDSLTQEFSRPVTLKVSSPEAVSLYFGEAGKGSKELVIGYVKIVFGHESVLQGVRKIVIQNTIIALLFICVSVVIVSLWVRSITKPLETLTREVRALGKETDLPYVPVQSRDEIGKLASEFNAMLDERRLAEQTRKNILRDLHDGVGGMMTNIVILSEIVRAKQLPEDIATTFATISALSRDGIAEIRSLIYSLDRNDLKWPSLIAEMRRLGNTMAEPHEIAYKMTAKMEEGVADPGSLLCLHLFKIYREAITNVIKHSQATKVDVDLSIGNERILLVVQDNGRGCSTDGLPCEGRGFTNMRSRAAEIGGTVTIEGDNGTRVSVEIPLPIPSETH